MSVLGAISQKDRGTGAALPSLELPPDRTGFFQNVGAGFTQAVAGPHSTQNARAIYESRQYDQIIAALKAEGEQATDMVQSPVLRSSPFYRPVEGEQVLPDGRVMIPVKRDFTNPFSEGPSLTRDVNPLGNLYLGGDAAEMKRIWDAVGRVRARKGIEFLKAFPDQAGVDAVALTQRQSDQATAGDVSARATTLGKVGRFIGGMAGSILSGDPENFVGGGFATAPAKSVSRQILTRAVEGGVANAAAGIVAVPGQATDAESMGQHMTTGEIVHSVGENAAAGFFLGGGHAALPHVPGAVGAVAGKAFDTVAPHLPDAVRDPIVAASIRAGTVKDRELLTEFQRLHAPYAAVDTSTPTEKAAAHVVNSDTETQEQSPLHPEAAGANHDRLSAVAKALGVDLTPPEVPTTAPVQTPTVRDQANGGRKPASFVDGINAAEGSTRNPRSTADGYGNFLESTWLSIAPHVADTAGMSRDQILALRHDKTTASKATEYYAAQNGAYLRSHGLEDSPGNLSLAHFLGAGDAAKVLRAAPSTPVESLLSPKVIEANHEVLRGKSADEVVAWAHKRIGAAVDHPPARPDAVPEEGFDPASPLPYVVENLKPEELPPTSAPAPTDEPFNPLLSQHLLVWENADGERSIIDGGKRLAHARAQDDQAGITLPTVVLRERDGISEEMALLVGKLKNVNLGTTSLEKAAGALADIPEIAQALRSPRFKQEIAAIAQLPYERFGDVVNGRLDARTAAQIGSASPQFDSNPVKAIAALPDEQFRTLGAALGVRRKFVDMRLASRFLDNKKLDDVRAAYLETVGQSMEEPHGDTTTIERPAPTGGGPREPLGREGRDLATEAPPEDVSSRGQPSLFDRAVAARDNAEKFSEPAGEGAKQQTALIEHDLRQEAGAQTRREKIKAATAALQDVKPGEFRSVEPFPDEEPGYHRFRYVAEDGTSVGGNYTLDKGPPPFVEGFNVGDPNNPVKLGAAEVRRLFDQLREQHPDVTRIHAFRMTGARVESGAGPKEMWIDLTGKPAKGEVAPENVPIYGEASKGGLEGDTRGKGVFYHGARGEVPELTEGYYNPNNIYGGFDTFYTTDALEIARGYQRKRQSGRVYRAEEKAPVNFFSMEDRHPVEYWDELLPTGSLEEVAIGEASAVSGDANLREIMDEIRDLSMGEGYSKDEVQEIFDGLIYNLRQRGFGGMTHIGGLKTGRAPHAVRIYFDAPNQLDLHEVPAPKEAANVTDNRSPPRGTQGDTRQPERPSQTEGESEAGTRAPDFSSYGYEVGDTEAEIERKVAALNRYIDQGGLTGDTAIRVKNELFRAFDAATGLPDPVHLFDLPETGFRLSEEGERPVSLQQALDQADADEAAAKALRDCL